MSEVGNGPAGFMLRGPALEQSRAAIRAASGLERQRRIRQLVTVAGGWVVAGLFACTTTAALGVMWNRPVPRDMVYVALVHDDGTREPAVFRDDLPKSRRALIFQNTVIQYVKARENYSWEGINANYRIASALSAPDELARYQGVMLNKKHPENPAALYGDGANTGIADVVKVQVLPNPGTVYAVDAVFTLRIRGPRMVERTIRKTARMTWMPAEDKVPAEVQQEFDPLGIAFTSYNSTPDLEPGT